MHAPCSHVIYFTHCSKSLCDDLLRLVCSDKVHGMLSKFDASFEQLSDWLEAMEEKVKAAVGLMPSLEDKQRQWTLLTQLGDEVTAKQREFDDVMNNAQMLRQHYTDQQVTSQLTSLHSRYLQLGSFVKVCWSPAFHNLIFIMLNTKEALL